jgi:hypothetical protein
VGTETLETICQLPLALLLDVNYGSRQVIEPDPLRHTSHLFKALLQGFQKELLILGWYWIYERCIAVGKLHILE